jgi:hypothetical protein
MSGVKISAFPAASTATDFEAAGVQDGVNKKINLGDVLSPIQAKADDAFSMAESAGESANAAAITAGEALALASSGSGAVLINAIRLEGNIFDLFQGYDSWYFVRLSNGSSTRCSFVIDRLTNFTPRITVISSGGELPKFRWFSEIVAGYANHCFGLRATYTADPGYILAEVFVLSPRNSLYPTPRPVSGTHTWYSALPLDLVSSTDTLIVKNTTSSTLAPGTVVRVASGELGVANVVRAQSDTKSGCSGVLVVADQIPVASLGLAKKGGPLRGVNLSAYSAGSILYVSPTVAGAVTATQPEFPNFSAKVGVVMDSDELYIEPDTDPQYQQISFSTAKYAATLDPAACDSNVGLFNAGSTNWVAMGTMLIPSDNLFITGSSEMAAICPQPAQGAKFIFAIYRYVKGGNYERIAYTPIMTMGDVSSWVAASIASQDSSVLEAAGRFYGVLLHNSNGAQFAGIWGNNLNSLPYISWYKANLGDITIPPETLTPDGEISQRLFLRIKA